MNLAKKQVSDSKDIPAIKNQFRFPKLHSSDFDVDQTSVDQYESTSKTVSVLCILVHIKEQRIVYASYASLLIN